MNLRALDIPPVQMGRVHSNDLFEDREQAVFDFYERNAGRYRHAIDVGANIGVHAVLMAKLGWRVLAFEPDPAHYEHLVANAKRNGVAELVIPYQFALATKAGDAEFVRVLGNTTASHIAGARGFHGEVERFTVKCIECGPYFDSVDFAKVDCEGLEADLLCAVTDPDGCDFMVEIGSIENAGRIYDHFRALGREMWAQDGASWKPVRSLADVPKHYTEGHLFIGKEP